MAKPLEEASNQRCRRRAGWLRSGLLTLGLLAASTVSAQTHSFLCPLRIAPAQAQAPDAVAHGFSVAFQPNALAYLIGVAVFDGPPEEGVEIPMTGPPLLPQWNLSGSKQGPVAVCRYEGGIQLGRTLGKGVKQCSASIKRSESKGSDGIAVDRAAFACQ